MESFKLLSLREQYYSTLTSTKWYTPIVWTSCYIWTFYAFSLTIYSVAYDFVES